ncbi:hypothetical protein GPECTOR_76g786 [Gonium pectorale]|uniref:Uncharacterized protein n=1 Tax=Gonium pectorale TaxID=33097 RepID=A0A150G377_GONPE|nr:hypothetical protein GPECTOR_76g786 [Gonium pectorale]|eukprot:KXZ43965.1 hypothetical protein GPECTOR_76g786 [Gonium pectorale]
MAVVRPYLYGPSHEEALLREDQGLRDRCRTAYDEYGALVEARIRADLERVLRRRAMAGGGRRRRQEAAVAAAVEAPQARGPATEAETEAAALHHLCSRTLAMETATRLVDSSHRDVERMMERLSCSGWGATAGGAAFVAKCIQPVADLAARLQLLRPGPGKSAAFAALCGGDRALLLAAAERAPVASADEAWRRLAALASAAEAAYAAQERGCRRGGDGGGSGGADGGRAAAPVAELIDRIGQEAMKVFISAVLGLLLLDRSDVTPPAADGRRLATPEPLTCAMLRPLWNAVTLRAATSKPPQRPPAGGPPAESSAAAAAPLPPPPLDIAAAPCVLYDALVYGGALLFVDDDADAGAVDLGSSVAGDGRPGGGGCMAGDDLGSCVAGDEKLGQGQQGDGGRGGGGGHDGDGGDGGESSNGTAGPTLPLQGQQGQEGQEGPPPSLMGRFSRPHLDALAGLLAGAPLEARATLAVLRALRAGLPGERVAAAMADLVLVRWGPGQLQPQPQQQRDQGMQDQGEQEQGEQEQGEQEKQEQSRYQEEQGHVQRELDGLAAARGDAAPAAAAATAVGAARGEGADAATDAAPHRQPKRQQQQQQERRQGQRLGDGLYDMLYYTAGASGEAKRRDGPPVLGTLQVLQLIDLEHDRTAVLRMRAVLSDAAAAAAVFGAANGGPSLSAGSEANATAAAAAAVADEAIRRSKLRVTCFLRVREAWARDHADLDVRARGAAAAAPGPWRLSARDFAACVDALRPGLAQRHPRTWGWLLMVLREAETGAPPPPPEMQGRRPGSRGVVAEAVEMENEAMVRSAVAQLAQAAVRGLWLLAGQQLALQDLRLCLVAVVGDYFAAFMNDPLCPAFATELFLFLSTVPSQPAAAVAAAARLGQRRRAHRRPARLWPQRRAGAGGSGGGGVAAAAAGGDSELAGGGAPRLGYDTDPRVAVEALRQLAACCRWLTGDVTLLLGLVAAEPPPPTSLLVLGPEAALTAALVLQQLHPITGWPARPIEHTSIGFEVAEAASSGERPVGQPASPSSAPAGLQLSSARPVLVTHDLQPEFKGAYDWKWIRSERNVLVVSARSKLSDVLRVMSTALVRKRYGALYVVCEGAEGVHKALTLTAKVSGELRRLHGTSLCACFLSAEWPQQAEGQRGRGSGGAAPLQAATTVSRCSGGGGGGGDGGPSGSSCRGSGAQRKGSGGGEGTPPMAPSSSSCMGVETAMQRLCEALVRLQEGAEVRQALRQWQPPPLQQQQLKLPKRDVIDEELRQSGTDCIRALRCRLFGAHGPDGGSSGGGGLGSAVRLELRLTECEPGRPDAPRLPLGGRLAAEKEKQQLRNKMMPRR